MEEAIGIAGTDSVSVLINISLICATNSSYTSFLWSSYIDCKCTRTEEMVPSLNMAEGAYTRSFVTVTMASWILLLPIFFRQ